MYQVDLKKYYRIYNIIPVSLLKLWTAPQGSKKNPFPDLKNDQKVYEPESIEIHMNKAKGY